MRNMILVLNRIHGHEELCLGEEWIDLSQREMIENIGALSVPEKLSGFKFCNKSS